VAGASVPVRLDTARSSLPTYAHTGDAGADLRAACGLVLKPFERALVPTGIALALPEGYAGLVLPRSGSALKHGLSLANSPGLIDSDYRGEVQVLAINLDPACDLTIHEGDRIAQLVLVRVEQADFVAFDQLEETTRGAQGFGSSGLQ